MRLFFTLFSLSWLVWQVAPAQVKNFGKNTAHAHAQPDFVRQGHVDSTVRFIANHRQWADNVLYRAEIPNGHAYLMEDGFHYGIYQWEKADQSTAIHAPRNLKGHGIRVKFKNAARKMHRETRPEGEVVTRYNFFLGDDKRRWASQVPAYHQVTYPNVYAGIDARVFGQYKTMKYEFYVRPHANPDAIRLAYEGADYVKVRPDDGFLEIGTSVGKILEQKPYCYQLVRGQEVAVPAEFRLVGKELSFVFPQGYDKNLPLVIDPVLVFSTYSGSTADNWGSTATFDEAGNLYSGGVVFGAGFPTTVGAWDTSANNDATRTDIGILKFSPDGKQLKAATYLGGTQSEFPHSLFVNKQNQLLVFGTTSSSDYPKSQNSGSFAGGTAGTFVGIQFTNGTDIVVTRFDETFSTVNFKSVIIGGSGNDGIVSTANGNAATMTLHNYGDNFRGEIVADSLGTVYVATTTNSPTLFPNGVPTLKSTLSGVQDGILMKLDAGLNVIWGTYIGGNGSDNAYSMKIDAALNVYVTGGTRSSDLRNIVEAGAATPMLANAQGDDDGYVAKFDKNGACKQITYVGSAGADQCFLLDLDTSGNVYVVGQTRGNYPISATANYKVLNSGQFIHKISGDLVTSLLSTRFGRNKGSSVTPDISPTAFLVNTCGNLYIMGWGSNVGESATNLSTLGLPTTPDAFRTNTDSNDFYIIILEKDFKSLLYATFFGALNSSAGDHVDGGTSRFDKRGIIYHAACASCGGFDDFPTTGGVWSPSNNAQNCNNAAFKFDIGSLTLDFNIRDAGTNIIIQKACKFPVPALISYEGQGVSKWTWFIDGVQVSTASSFTHNFPTAGDYTVKLIGENPASCLKSDTVTRLFRISAIEVQQMPNDTICAGDAAQLNATVNSTNPFTFSWSPTTGLSNPNIANPKASPTETTTYTVTAKDNNDCEVKREVTVYVIPEPPDDIDILNAAGVKITRGCVPAELKLTYNFARYQITTWEWEVEGIGVFPNQLVVNLTLTNPGIYKIKLKVKRDGRCPKDFLIDRQIELIEFKADAGASKAICLGESTQLQAIDTPAGSAVSYVWTPATGLNNPNIANPLASPTQTTIYKVTMRNADGCEASDTLKVDVTNKPILDFDLALGSDCAKPTTVTFANKSLHVAAYEWTISKDGVLIATFREATPAPYDLTKAGKYKIKLYAVNGICNEFLEKEIEVEDNLSLPPNTITPNGDGKNDTFTIAPERIGYKVEIYNRWGAPMFKSDEYKDDWGKDITAGLYYYILTSPKGVQCKGWLNVIR